MSDESCDVCGRSILAGESTREYLTAEGDRNAVCVLCRPRAEGAGWVPADRAAELLVPRGRERGGRGRLRRLLGRGERRGEREQAAQGGTRESEPAPRRRAKRPKKAAAEPETRAEEPRSPRGRSVPRSPERRMRRALDAFNGSEHKRTVAGLIRSLGAPSVCVATVAGDPAGVRVTVAWELSWYQWEVDVAGDGGSVRELAKGAEQGELAEGDRSWNARATESGELRLGLRSRRSAPVGGGDADG